MMAIIPGVTTPRLESIRVEYFKVEWQTGGVPKEKYWGGPTSQPHLEFY